MTTIVLEVQVNSDDSVGTLITSYTDRTEAESKYHMVLSAAAVSDKPIHSAFMIDPKGKVIRSEFYEHKQEG